MYKCTLVKTKGMYSSPENIFFLSNSHRENIGNIEMYHAKTTKFICLAFDSHSRSARSHECVSSYG